MGIYVRVYILYIDIYTYTDLAIHLCMFGSMLLNLSFVCLTEIFDREGGERERERERERGREGGRVGGREGGREQRQREWGRRRYPSHSLRNKAASRLLLPLVVVIFVAECEGVGELGFSPLFLLRAWC